MKTILAQNKDFNISKKFTKYYYETNNIEGGHSSQSYQKLLPVMCHLGFLI